MSICDIVPSGEPTSFLGTYQEIQREVYTSRANSTVIYLVGSQIDVSTQTKCYSLAKYWHAVFESKVCRSVADAADRAYSYVIVTTKAVPDVIRTSDILNPLLSAPYCDKYAQPTYVLIQNGLNVELDLYQALKSLAKGEPRIINTAVYISANLLDDNIVEDSDYVPYFSSFLFALG